MLDQKKVLNRINLIQFIKQYYYGYFYFKAKLKFIIKFLLILSQFVLTIVFLSKKYECINKAADNTSKMYWLNLGVKYEVKIVRYHLVFFLRIVLFLYDIIFIINEIIFLKDFKKIQVWWIFPYVFRITKLFILVFINVKVLLDKVNCVISRNDKNLFYLENKYNINFILFIFDVIKSFITLN